MSLTAQMEGVSLVPPVPQVDTSGVSCAQCISLPYTGNIEEVYHAIFGELSHISFTIHLAS